MKTLDADCDFVKVEQQSALLDKIYKLRVTAWATEVPDFRNREKWHDEWDAIALHWAFLYSGEPVAAARLSIHSTLTEVPQAECYIDKFPNPLQTPIASLSRLVVHPLWRGKGFAAKLDEIRLITAESHGCKCAIGITDSGQHRVNQLQRAGFYVVGEALQNHDDGPRTKHPLLIINCTLPRMR